ncbi:MAG: ABC transporter substrate-binding protein [Betaproteobacteria bacterium]|nr:MAG: ABC transporter substrate-binding protein [Betaproteobacteria bacterium]TMI09599.1 MAG: ABC transporter substrate-binding protein [Betaproteobacteria bacterium]
MRLWVFFFLILGSPPTWAAHAYAQFGDIKYPRGFPHFEWVNPNAPKGGELDLVAALRITNFDKYNPFTLKGTSPPGLGNLVFETLLTPTLDEPTTAYGLLAEDIEVAADGLAVTFRLNPKARFHHGKPVMAADVKHSFDILMTKEANPQFRVVYGDVKRAVVLGPRTVRFEFARASAELPLLVGGLAVFSRDWGAGKSFDKVVMDIPIASGPYRVGRVNFGRDITYERDPDYWGRDLGVRRGMFNFDRITYKIYRDNVAQTEAFKAGEFDFLRVFSAREWARIYTGKKFDSGELVKAELPFANAGDFQGFLINTRRDKFKDVRVREALALAFDFEWMSRRLMYNSYLRCRGYFNNSDFEAKGLPGPDELQVLEPLRNKLSEKIFREEVPQPPSTDPPNSLRGNLQKARELLAAAGWTYRDGALRNAKGEAFTLEYMDSGGGERVMTPYIQALAKLGIRLDYRRADFALYRKRLNVFDFDLFSLRIPGSEAPGADLLDFFGSQSADTEGSSNWIGVRDPAVDAIVNLALSAATRPQLVARLRALDRVLRHGHYVIPQWYSSTHRVAYRAGKFEQPEVKPLYYAADDWVVLTWWRKR